MRLLLGLTRIGGAVARAALRLLLLLLLGDLNLLLLLLALNSLVCIRHHLLMVYQEPCGSTLTHSILSELHHDRWPRDLAWLLGLQGLLGRLGLIVVRLLLLSLAKLLRRPSDQDWVRSTHRLL